MARRNIILIILGALIIVVAFIAVMLMSANKESNNALQENTKAIFSEQKTQKIEKTLERINKQRFQTTDL